MFNSFIMTEHWLKQPKIQPCHITVERHTMKMHQPTANMPFQTGTEIKLDQVKYTYPYLAAFINTEHWLKQPRMLYPANFVC